MSEALTKKDRALVRERAGDKCEYCLLSKTHSFLSFHIDHIISQKHGGDNLISNLAWSCPQCNYHKGSDLGTRLAGQPEIIPLFNPRLNSWGDHFIIKGGRIVGLTDIGKATEKLLQFNASERLAQRQILIEANLFP